MLNPEIIAIPFEVAINLNQTLSVAEKKTSLALQLHFILASLPVNEKRGSFFYALFMTTTYCFQWQCNPIPFYIFFSYYHKSAKYYHKYESDKPYRKWSSYFICILLRFDVTHNGRQIMKYDTLLLVLSHLHIIHISVSRNRFSFPVSSLGFCIDLFSSQSTVFIH